MSSCNIISYVLLFIAIVMIFKLLQKYSAENFGPEIETSNVVSSNTTPLPEDHHLANYHPTDVGLPLLSESMNDEKNNLKLQLFEKQNQINSEFKSRPFGLLQESETPRRVIISELPSSEAYQETEHFGSIGKIRRRCPVQHDDTDADTFIRRSLVSGKKLCNTISEYDNRQLADYRDTFFNFRNKIWQTSNNVDTVDKLADMYLSGNSDVARGYKGKKISDLFNSLTQN